MTTTAQCPVCGNPQAQGLLDDACTTKLEQALAEVRALMGELDVTISRQDRVPIASNGRPADPDDDSDPGLGTIAHTRNPVGWRAVNAADDLANCLTSWARAVTNERIPWGSGNPASRAARILLSNVPAIRRHKAVKELVEGVHDGIAAAWRAVDRASEKRYLGICRVVYEDQECTEEIWASRWAGTATCKVCGITHDVAERRAKMLDHMEDVILSVKDASYVLGELGGIKVSQASIRGYLHRGRIAYRPGVQNGIRLGDLLTVVLDDSEKKGAA